MQNNILVQTLVHSTLKINELEAILKKVQRFALTCTLTHTSLLTYLLTLFSNSVESISPPKHGNQPLIVLSDLFSKQRKNLSGRRDHARPKLRNLRYVPFLVLCLQSSMLTIVSFYRHGMTPCYRMSARLTKPCAPITTS